MDFKPPFGYHKTHRNSLISNPAFRQDNPKWQFKKAKDFREKIYSEIQSMIQPENDAVNIDGFFKIISEEKILEFDHVEEFLDDDHFIFRGPIFQNDEVIAFEQSIINTCHSESGLDLSFDDNITDSQSLFSDFKNQLDEKEIKDEKESLLSLVLNLLSSSDYHQTKVDFNYGHVEKLNSQFLLNHYCDTTNKKFNMTRAEFKEFYFNLEKHEVKLENSIFIKVFRNLNFLNEYKKVKHEKKNLINLETFIFKNFLDIIDQLQVFNISFKENILFREKVVNFLFFKFKFKFENKIFYYTDFSYVPSYLRFNNSFCFLPLCSIYLPLDIEDIVLALSMRGELKLLARNDSLTSCISHFKKRMKGFNFKRKLDYKFDFLQRFELS